jgi:sucrose-6-phosphate hydrolase SacC (GH32 family)
MWMKKRLAVEESYFYFPVKTGGQDVKVELFLEDRDEKIYEFLIPVDSHAAGTYPCDFYAEVPVEQFQNQTIRIETEAPEAFLEAIRNESKTKNAAKEHRPCLRFTAGSGWTNDPNGLIYQDGIYHLYFQYNPFDVKWNNMSWGHATSQDLLHWEQQDTTLFPDEKGTMFSGSAISNEREMLGLPGETILYYYTSAGGVNPWSEGKAFTQCIAFSNDGGKTLQKIKEPCIETLYKENRDPKVFWHEESKAYIMVLWLRGNEFSIFRSEDLKNWEQTSCLTLEEAWECPDLFCLHDEQGESTWFFWTADGFYYPGTFDGYQFVLDGERHLAYVNQIPYAAQTYSNVSDRVISIPWLRLENDGRTFTGTFGIPVELSYQKKGGQKLLIQRPVRELQEQAKLIFDSEKEEKKEQYTYQPEETAALMIQMTVKESYPDFYRWEINGSRITYHPASGELGVDDIKYQVGFDHHTFCLIVDDRILELFFDDGIRLGTFVLKEENVCFAMNTEMAENYKVYQIQ